jgi:hypothetical protein
VQVAPQHLWQQSYLRQLWLRSWTRVWSYAQVGVGSILFFLHILVTDPTIQAAITPLQIPAYVWAGLTVLGVVTYVAHGHNADVDP